MHSRTNNNPVPLFSALSKTFLKRVTTLCLLLFISSCALRSEQAQQIFNDAPLKLLTVSCLLPAHPSSKSHTETTYNILQTSGRECNKQAGEYIVFDHTTRKAALRVWLPHAESGSPEAQTYVGELYENLVSTLEDYQQAALWYQRATNQHYPSAMVKLARLYENGLGVKPDFQQALDLYQQALELEPGNSEHTDSPAYKNWELYVSTRIRTLRELNQEGLRSQTLTQADTADQNIGKKRELHDNSLTTISKPQVVKTDNSAQEALAYNIDFGRYHALVIGNHKYDNLNDLKTAEHDSAAITRIFKQQFGINTTVLMNATQKQTLLALERLRASLGNNDNLLIYYAGHTTIDKSTGQEHWLPSDASIRNTQKWLPFNTVSAILNNMPAKHVLVISNTCFSSANKSTTAAHKLPSTDHVERTKWLAAVSAVRVRSVLCATGLSVQKPVSSHSGLSQFAQALATVLEHQSEAVDAHAVFYEMQQLLLSTAEYSDTNIALHYAPIADAGHLSGDFIFVPQKTN